MPAKWPPFIKDLASTLQSQEFTKPGGAQISYEPPEIGATKVLGKSVDEDGKPLQMDNNNRGNVTSKRMVKNDADGNPLINATRVFVTNLSWDTSAEEVKII